MSRCPAILRLAPLAPVLPAFAAVLLGWPSEASALLRGIGFQPDVRERLLMSAFSGFTLGLALGLLIYELRARGVSIALRRLTDLAVSMDGRFTEESRRGKIKQELERLSDEVLFSVKRMSKSGASSTSSRPPGRRCSPLRSTRCSCSMARAT
jgi:hypothetical protein